MHGRLLFYTRGSVLVFTTGAYSDFRLSGFLVAIRDLDLKALAKEFVADEKASTEELLNRGRPDDFASWLVAKGHAMPVDAAEIHLGDDGEWEREFEISADNYC
jgi:hypothetical protein